MAKQRITFASKVTIFCVLMSFVNSCVSEKNRQLGSSSGEETLFVFVNNKEVQNGDFLPLEQNQVNVTIENTSDALSGEYSITNNTDPNSQEVGLLKPKSKTVKILTVKSSEGNVIYTITFSAANSKAKNKASLILTNPSRVEIQNTGYLPEFTQANDKNSPFDFDRLNIELIFKSSIRKSSEFFEQRKLFLEKSITADRVPNIYFILIDTLRKDYLERYAPVMKKFLEDGLTPEYHLTDPLI